MVARWRRGFERVGLVPGHRVALLLRNCVEWVCFDQAALAAGLVVVPLYTTDSTEGIAHILADSGARLLLVGAEQQWRQLAPHRTAFPALEWILCLEPAGMQTAEGEPSVAVAEWLPADSAGAAAAPLTIELATIIYTSGTTGRPKGVMLSHRNMLSIAEAVLERNRPLPGDVFLSFLPLAHCFERVVGYYLPMMCGGRVVYARSVEQLAEDFLIARPSVLLAVPRIYERLYAAVRAKAEGSRLVTTLLAWSEAIGWRRFEAAMGRAASFGPWERAEWAVLHRFFGDRLIGRLGGRVRIAVSGGAPLPERVARFLVAIGLPLVEGYGLTEAASAVTADSIDGSVPGSVGEPLRGVQVRLGGNGEVLVRGPGVMLGYWNGPDLTRAVIDADGWLHTGDIGAFQGRHLFIRGRLKEILVTATGEKVSPAELEAVIGLDPMFEQAVVLGEGRSCLAALLVLSRVGWGAFAVRLRLDPDDPRSLRAPAATSAILERLALLLKAFPEYAQVRAAHLSLRPWTIADGLLTPTLKPKRGELEARFAQEVQELYRGHEGGAPGRRWQEHSVPKRLGDVDRD